MESLDGRIKFSDTLSLLAMPSAANLVYGLAAVFPPPEDLLRFSFQSIHIFQMLVGGGFFIWAWVDTVKD